MSVPEGLDGVSLPFGSLPTAVAVLLTTPASTSAWVMVCGAVAVQVVAAPGASVVTGQVTAPAVGSLTTRLVIVVVPVFWTRNDQAIVSPRSVFPSAFTSVTAADLVSCSAGA